MDKFFIFCLIGGLLVIGITIAVFIILGRKIKERRLSIRDAEYELYQIEIQKEQCNSEMQAAIEQKTKAQTEADVMEQYNKKMRDQADESAQAYYNSIMEKTKNEIDAAIQNESNRYQEAQAQFEEDYGQVMRDMATEAARYASVARKLVNEIDDLEHKQRAAIEAQKRAAEEQDKIDFYRIQIPESDLLEISKLREILPYLRDQDTLNKVIYKIYYENPVNDLIGRVVGKKQGGIYKITNIHNKKCYVGQAVNFANRWKQHIKRGMGAEPITHNKLYPAMIGDGVENFTFEIIEECSPDKLNQREDYWQNFFGAKEYGYSIK